MALNIFVFDCKATRSAYMKQQIDFEAKFVKFSFETTVVTVPVVTASISFCTDSIVIACLGGCWWYLTLLMKC